MDFELITFELFHYQHSDFFFNYLVILLLNIL